MSTPVHSTTLERWVALGVGCAVVLALLFLVVSNAHLNASLALPVRLLLALAAAVFGGALPGAAFNVGFERGGLAIRAAGAAGFFAIVWLGGPGLLSNFLAKAPPAAAVQALR